MASKASLIAKAFGDGGAFSQIANKTLSASNRKLSSDALAPGVAGSVTVSDTAPTSPSAGDQWYNSLDLNLYVYYNDGSSSQWVPSAPQQAGPAGADGTDGTSATPVSYANIAAFPSSGNTTGDLGFAINTKAMYVWDGVEWDRISSGSNEVPEITTEPAAGINLATDGSTTSTITMAATDPEGFPITYSHDTSPSNQAQATSITESGGVFTLTPSGTQSNAGSFTLRTKASDGVHVTTRSSTIKLAWGISNVYGIQFYETSRYYNAYVHYYMLVGPNGNWHDDATFRSEATYSTHQWEQGNKNNSNVTAFYRKYFNDQLPVTFGHTIADTANWNNVVVSQSGSGNGWMKWTTPRILSGVLNSGHSDNDYGYMREGYYRLYIGGTTAGDLAATQYTLTPGSASDTGNTGQNGVPIAQINRLYDHTLD